MSGKIFSMLSVCDPCEYLKADLSTERSLFTMHLWEGLQGKAFDNKYHVTPAALAEYMGKAMEEASAEKPATAQALYFRQQGEGRSPALAKLEKAIEPIRGKRSAVCMGVDVYRDASIYGRKYASDDANSIFKALTQGPTAIFEPTLSFLYCNGDGTRKNIYDAIYNLRYVMKEDDLLLLYYAGNTCRGMDGAPVLLCHDTEMKSYEFTGLSFGKLQELFDPLPCHVAVILDACRIASVTGR